MLNEESDESLGVEQLPQDELEASPGINPETTDTIVDLIAEGNQPPSAEPDSAQPAKRMPNEKSDESLGVEQLPQDELEASPGINPETAETIAKQ